MSSRTFVAFDLETTGLNPKRDAIIEFGAVRFREGRPRERFAACINPGRPLPLRIQQITGIHPADVADAPSIDELLPEIRAFIGENVDAVVAHSAGFDVSFLRAAGVEISAPVLDTHELATILLPGQASYSLGELCRALDIPLSAAHRAGPDAEATADLLLRLVERVEALPTGVLASLCAAGIGSEWGPLLLFEEALRRRQSAQRPVASRRPPSQPAPAAPVSPRSSGIEISDGFLNAAFGESSARFERRDGQLDMARQVLDALNRGDHKIIEAGTGTGKSLAYLLPAAAWAAVNRCRVVIATNTIPLQDQLLEQELPRIVQVLGETDLVGDRNGTVPVQAMALKGRSRYLCTRRLARWLDRPRPSVDQAPLSIALKHGPRLSPLELRLLAKILVWLPHTQNGDISALPIHDRREQALLANVTSQADECSPERCRARIAPGQHDHLGGRYRDFYLEAHRQAESAHLLVVNHALLLADVEAGGQVLPDYDHLIIDESHRLESAATEQFTKQIDLRLLTSLLEGVERAATAVASGQWSVVSEVSGQRSPGAGHWEFLVRRLAADCRTLQTTVPTFFGALLDFALRHCGLETGAKRQRRAAPGRPQPVALDNRVRAQPAWSEIEILWDEVSAQLRGLLGPLTELAVLLDASNWWQLEQKTRNAPAARSHGFSLQALHRAQTDLPALLQVADDVILRPLHIQEQSVAWVELSARSAAQRGPDAVILRSAPIQVSEKLAADLFSPRRAVILTGATLQAGDRFDFLRDRLGCWEANGSVIDSPFDYKCNALLYMPSDMPTPDHHNYQQALEQAVQHAALAAEGRTLGLFTSHSHLHVTAEAVRAPLAAAGLTVLQQGEGSRRRNLRDFRSNPRSLLLGTSSYWEGIDLPGDQLVCLLIARLPFAVPSDPLYAARSRGYEDAFHEYAVPDAVIRLRQGFGRLIRSAADRGVVVLLDSRLWQRSYGQIFLDALPPCTTRRSPLSHLDEAVRAWLRP